VRFEIVGFRSKVRKTLHPGSAQLPWIVLSRFRAVGAGGLGNWASVVGRYHLSLLRAE
jgi:hypothetical protein